MLTITFIKDNERNVISCDSYAVEVEEGSGITFLDVKKGYGAVSQVEVFSVLPNSQDDWAVAYVTNLAGKTIDRIGSEG